VQSEDKMNTIRNTFSLSLVVISIALGMAGAANAQRRNDKDIRDAVRTLNSKIEDFETNLRYQMQSSSSNNTQVADVGDDIRSLRDSVQQFQDDYDRKRDSRDGVNNIVDAARLVNEFLQTNPQNRRVESDWDAVRKQIDRLASNYGITNDWQNVDGRQQSVRNDPPYQNNSSYPNGSINVGLSGTYDLDAGRSENIDDIVNDTKLGTDQREDLKDKLTAPQQIAIDVRGNQVILATTNNAPVTVVADGRDKAEQSASGKTVRTRATLNGNVLTVSSLGGENDFTITFTSVSNGKTMKVSRRITTDYLSQTVFAESVYNKTDSVARLGINGGGNNNNAGNNSNPPNPVDNNGGYSDNDNSGNVSNGGTTNRNGNGNGNGNQGRRPVAVTAKPGNYVVPNGVVLSGTLVNEINTKISQNNDRFRMTVQSPDEFRGATIEGYISGLTRSGKVSGQPTVTLNCDKITLKDGQTYDFAGYLQTVTDISGKSIAVNNEGTIKGDSQTRETAKRGGVGAGVGAIIGAIAGGGKGAAIGAIIGGGAGAGSVAVTGQTDIQLQQGSTITVQSTSPTNAGPR
ncbi:MAG: hypothetical protein ABJB40_00700, partial [Acidobacteriota bacterium]